MRAGRTGLQCGRFAAAVEVVCVKYARHVPLLVTLFRLLLGPAFVLARPVGAWLMFLIVVVAIFSDWLDGFLARRWGLVSLGGKLLDPFADALFCMVAFYLCWRPGEPQPGAATLPVILPGWVYAALIGREALVTFVVRPVALARGMVISASMTGKVKTCFQFGLIVTYVVLQVRFFTDSAFLIWLARLGVYAVLGLSVSSAGVYVWQVAAALRGKVETGKEGSAEP